MFNGSRNKARLAAQRDAERAMYKEPVKKEPKQPKRILESLLPNHTHASNTENADLSDVKRDMDDQVVIPEARKWENVQPSLSPPMLKAVASLGFRGMTPVQAAAIPAFMSNQDVCVQAVTGSGKTLSFVIPSLEIMMRKVHEFGPHDVGIVCISPTRELAMQTSSIYSHFTSFLEAKFSVAMCVGGMNTKNGPELLRRSGTNILVGTPGRLLDVLSYTFVNRKALEVLILDEADRLLDSGFTVQMSQLFDILPKQRRTGLFSATLTEQVEELSKAGLRNPVRITVKVQYKSKNLGQDGSLGSSTEDATSVAGHQNTPSSLANSYAIVPAKERLLRLVQFLLERQDQKIIVFFLTCATVEYVYHCLSQFKPIADRFIDSARWSKTIEKNPNEKRGIICALTGQMPQAKRTHVYSNFRQAPSGILLCTDVAARGVDIKDLGCVLQFESPQNPDYFIHRVGRTARAGKEGSATLFLLPEEVDFIDYLRERSVPLTKQTLPELDPSILAEIEEPVKEDVTIIEMGTPSKDTSDKDDDDIVSEDSDNEEEDEDEDEDMDEQDGENSNPECKTTEPNKDETLLGAKRQREGDNETQDDETASNANEKETTDKPENTDKPPRPTKLIVKVYGSDTNVVSHFRAMVANDRAVFNLSASSFVASVRAYQEHLLRFIFAVDSFPYRDAALGMGMLYFPILPDLKRYRVKYPTLTQLLPRNIPYLDPVKEAGRAKEEANKRRQNEIKRKERIQKELDRKKRREFLMENRKKKNKTKAKKTYEEFAKEWSELKEESRGLKQEGSKSQVLKRIKASAGKK